MIQVEGLSKIFDKIPVVADISFSVAGGETLVLLGTSGSGKTTTLKMLNRLIEPSSGKVYINGNDIALQQPEELRRNIGYVIQQTGLFPHYTVEENIAVVPVMLKWPAKKIRERVYQLMELLSIPPAQLAGKYPHQLSGGQQQRVGLARALAANPPVVLMDEPFGALDPIIRHSIRQEFLQLDELKDKTTILVTHDVTEAVLLADKICLMDKGKIQQTGTAKELLMQPANAFVQQFFQQNRFQLQLMVHTLHDVLPTAANNNYSVNSLIFDGETTIWEVMNQIQAINHPPKTIGIRHGPTVHYISIEAIMHSYLQDAGNGNHN